MGIGGLYQGSRTLVDVIEVHLFLQGLLVAVGLHPLGVLDERVGHAAQLEAPALPAALGLLKQLLLDLLDAVLPAAEQLIRLSIPG